MRYFWQGVIGALLLSACSLAGDITPPPGLRPTSIPASPAAGGLSPTQAPSAILAPPARRPSAGAGAVLFAEHCAPCHGQTGRGDGPMVAELITQRPGPLPDFSSPLLARAATPMQWFQIITLGRLEQLMPPWADALSAAERWDLVAFLYTLSTGEIQIESGQTIYQANCAECHGEAGAGDGPKASTLDRPLPDFGDLAYMAALSQVDFFSAVTEGSGEAMHAFADALTEDERWAVVDYVRAFSYDYVAPGARPAEMRGTVTGQLINGTGGASILAGQAVLLHAFDDFAEVAVLTTTVAADGAFRFADVPYLPNRQFVVSTNYGGVTYGSDVQDFASGESTLDLPVTVYEVTPDARAARVQRMHVFFDFATGRVTVGELYIFSNESDRTIWKPDGALEFALPAEASDLNVQGTQEGQGFLRTAQGFTILQPVRPGPGTAQVLFSFSLPYDRQLEYAQTLLYPVDVANVLIPDVGVRVNGANLQDLGVQDIQGTAFRSYSASGLRAGDTLAFELSGRPATSSGAALSASNTTSLAIGAGALALALLGIGIWWYRRQSAAGEDEADDFDDAVEDEPAAAAAREALLGEIADLDDGYEAGEIDQRDYERERARLKAKLMELWE